MTFAIEVMSVLDLENSPDSRCNNGPTPLTLSEFGWRFSDERDRKSGLREAIIIFSSLHELADFCRYFHERLLIT